MQEKKTIVELDNVRVWFPIKKGIAKRIVGYVKAVDGVSFKIYEGETVGIVGESGCGKTTVGKAILRLLEITDGSIKVNIEGNVKDITHLSHKEDLNFRKKAQMIFQDPYSALNPMKNIYTSFEAPLKVHGIRNRAEREAMMEKALELVNIPLAYLYKYPHEFSGGQRQRICIARAMQINPKLVVCDEVVSALDVSIQAQVLNLLKKIQKERQMTYIFIAHDLSVVEYMSDRIVVMYLGEVVEVGESKSLCAYPVHPYTKSLISAVPIPDIHRTRKRIVLKGDVPSPIDKPAGCSFHTRCEHCMDICRTQKPELVDVPGISGRQCACHLINQ